MILTDRMIREAVTNGDIKITDFDDGQVQPASYDLRVGVEGVTTSHKEVVNIKKRGYVVLVPGDFGVICTLESVGLSDQFTARIGLRSKFARKGIIATTGPQIDPGFNGKLVVGLTNLTPNPVSLAYKDDFITLEFHKLEEPVEHPYDGPYQNTTGLRPEDIALATEQEGLALSDMMKTLSSLSANVSQLTNEVGYLKWILGIGIVVIGVITSIR